MSPVLNGAVYEVLVHAGTIRAATNGRKQSYVKRYQLDAQKGEGNHARMEENRPKAWHGATKRGIMIAVGVFGGFMVETLFLEDWPWWAWGIMALLGVVAWVVVDQLERRARKQQRPPPEEEEYADPTAPFTEEEALAFIAMELPVYWPVPGVRWVRKRATREKAARLLAEFEEEDPSEFSQDGYHRMALYVRVGVEK